MAFLQLVWGIIQIGGIQMRIEDIPDRVEEIMKERGITKYYLKHHCQIEDKFLRNILKDRGYNMTLGSMQKLSDALGVTLGYFFSPEEEKREATEEMQQTMILMEELDPKMQNRVLGYVQSIAQLEKEKRED